GRVGSYRVDEREGDRERSEQQPDELGPRPRRLFARNASQPLLLCLSHGFSFKAQALGSCERAVKWHSARALARTARALPGRVVEPPRVSTPRALLKLRASARAVPAGCRRAA